MHPLHQVVRQNAVKVRHVATGLQFLALIPFHNLCKKKIIFTRDDAYDDESTAQRLFTKDFKEDVSFDLDGSVKLRSRLKLKKDEVVAMYPGQLTGTVAH
jgi:hypothetical protein